MAAKKPRARVKDANPRKYKKKTSPLILESIDYVDYKNVDLLNRFMSDRAKIRNRRVTGNDVQQQRDIANAIKVAREMGLLPYARRVASASRQRPPRDGDGGGRRSRDSAEAEVAESPVAALVGADELAVDSTDDAAIVDEVVAGDGEEA
ncbi:MAG TPA: 30S ribosomal protein S18 [Ilumatobacteraceae bacterium]|nr:30S ribosomal protein S18 [Ilumatobacteraceae bacterium]